MTHSGLLQSMPLRLTLALVALFMLVSLVSFGASYFVIRQAMENAHRASLVHEMAGFRAAPNGRALAQLVRGQAAVTDPGIKIVSYTDAFGQHFGNGTILRSGEGFAAVKAQGVQGEVARTYFALTERIHGGLMTLAASGDARGRLRQIFATVLLVSLLPTAAIALCGGLLLARRSAWRFEAIETTLNRLTSGDLAARVPAMPGRADALSRIGARIDRMAAAQEASVSALRQVSADIAHDLKTPIQRVAVLLERLRNGGGDRRALIDRAQAETRGIVDTFQALLQIAQIEGGSPRARFAPVDLGELVATIGELYAPEAEARGQRLTVRAEATKASGDRTLLGKVLANLIENALAHAPAGTAINVAALAGPRPRLRVADTGQGIAPAERSNVLRRHYRLDTARSTPGSGLGLSLVKVIAELHDAELTLSDNRPGLVVELAFPGPVGGTDAPAPKT